MVQHTRPATACKIVQSTLVAGLHDNPMTWNVDAVQQYIAKCGFLDISWQLKDEVGRSVSIDFAKLCLPQLEVNVVKPYCCA